ncbi:MAG: uncharacterized membrane protein YgdD (TMEM256/DUF423 family) [Cellvibrionaceae bacterium]|jgi:uncharacterized membrane protein YgdD (TMEM256/DUF423 family)
MLKLWLSVTAISGLLAVGLGAFAAHGLKGKISDTLLSAFQTATHYQMFHTLALLALLVLISQLTEVPRLLWFGVYAWLIGVVLFSGSLYWLALGGPAWLGPVTPLGGFLLLLGWFALAVGVWGLSL